MSLCRIEPASVVAQLKANRLLIESKTDLEVAGLSMPKRISQNLLGNTQKIFLPLLRQRLRFTLNREVGAKVRIRDHLPGQGLDRRAQILPCQEQRAERMDRAARFLQALAGEFARPLSMSSSILGEILRLCVFGCF